MSGEAIKMSGEAVIEILVNYGASEEMAKRYVAECEHQEGLSFWDDSFETGVEICEDFDLYVKNDGLDP